MDKREDEMVIVAGDKDYVPVIEKLQARGIKVIICFWGHAARELKDLCDQFYNLDEYLDYLKR